MWGGVTEGVPVLGVGGRVQGCSGWWDAHLGEGGCLCTDVGNNNQKVLFGSC